VEQGDVDEGRSPLDWGRFLFQARRSAGTFGASLADLRVYVFSTRGIRGIAFRAFFLASDVVLRHVSARRVRRGPLRAPRSAHE